MLYITLAVGFVAQCCFVGPPSTRLHGLRWHCHAWCAGEVYPHEVPIVVGLQGYLLGHLGTTTHNSNTSCLFEMEKYPPLIAPLFSIYVVFHSRDNLLHYGHLAKVILLKVTHRMTTLHGPVHLDFNFQRNNFYL